MICAETVLPVTYPFDLFSAEISISLIIVIEMLLYTVNCYTKTPRTGFVNRANNSLLRQDGGSQETA